MDSLSLPYMIYIKWIYDFQEGILFLLQNQCWVSLTAEAESSKIRIEKMSIDMLLAAGDRSKITLIDFFSKTKYMFHGLLYKNEKITWLPIIRLSI